MNYADITHDDMLNGPGLRVVLWLTGCNHQCKECQNPETWDHHYGYKFTEKDEKYIYSELSKDYINGITFTGGDPFYPENRSEVLNLINRIKKQFPYKSIWVYTGYTFEEILNWSLISTMLSLMNIDVLVDGPFIKELKDEKLHWIGSSNQRIIDVQQTILQNNMILYQEKGVENV